MTSRERVARDNKIVALRARGFSESAIAERFGLNRDHVGAIMAEWRDTAPTLRTIDPLVIIDQMLEGYQADLEQLAEVADHADNAAAKVGAVNARMAARDRIIALLQTTGVLPHDLGKLRVDVDIRYVAQKIVQILNANQVSDQVQHELLAALQSGEIPELQEIHQG